MADRRGGVIALLIDGERVDVKGNVTYNLGLDANEPILGASGPQGYKSVPQVPRCEGTLTDRAGLDVAEMMRKSDAQIVLELANDKSIAFQDAYFGGEGDITTEEGEISFRFYSDSAEEV